jgi:hypothetical protein
MIPRATAFTAWLVVLSLGLGCATEPDLARPEASGAFTVIDGYATYVPGDTLTLTLSGTDDQGLEWLGFDLLRGRVAVRDSFPVRGRSVTRSVSLLVPATWIGNSELSAFARDASGNVDGTTLDSIHVVNAIRRPMTSLSLPALVLDFVADSEHNVLYLSLPHAQQVAILDLTARAFRSPIQLFGSPWGLDLTPGNDSLVVALRRTHALAFVNLGTGVVDTIGLVMPTDFAEGPGTLRVMGNGKVVHAITFDGTGYEADGFRVFDLATKTDRSRRDAFIGGASSDWVPLVRNSDRSRLVAVVAGNCCPAAGNVYAAPADTFGAHRPTVDRFYPAVSGDALGSRFLIDDVVFDSTLTEVVRLGPQTVDSLRNWATVISPDGKFAYIARDQAYKKMRIDGVSEIERVLIPVTPYLMIVPPRGDALIAFTGSAAGSDSRVWIIELK